MLHASIIRYCCGCVLCILLFRSAPILLLYSCCAAGAAARATAPSLVRLSRISANVWCTLSGLLMIPLLLLQVHAPTFTSPLAGLGRKPSPQGRGRTTAAVASVREYVI